MAPLGKEHCMIFYYLGLMTLFFAIFAVGIGIVYLFDKKTRMPGFILMLNSFTMFFMYYLYRIIYSICIKTL
jgi:hypothetical protein